MTSNPSSMDGHAAPAGDRREATEAWLGAALALTLIAMAWATAAGHGEAALLIGGACIGLLAGLRVVLLAANSNRPAARAVAPRLVLPALVLAASVLPLASLANISATSATVYACALFATLCGAGLASRL